MVDICVVLPFHRSRTSSSRNGQTKSRGSQNPRCRQLLKSFCGSGCFCVHSFIQIHEVFSCELTLLDTVVKFFGQGLLSMESCKCLRMVGTFCQRCHKSWSVGGSVLSGICHSVQKASQLCYHVNNRGIAFKGKGSATTMQRQTS